MVKVLVATIEGQGSRPDDYAWAIDGELVYIPAQACECPGCGCGRGFTGMASNRATTTALVVDRPDLTVGDLRNALSDSAGRQLRAGGDEPVGDGTTRALSQRLLAAVAHFQVGSILERDGERLRRRALAEPIHLPFGALGDDRS